MSRNSVVFARTISVVIVLGSLAWAQQLQPASLQDGSSDQQQSFEQAMRARDQVIADLQQRVKALESEITRLQPQANLISTNSAAPLGASTVVPVSAAPLVNAPSDQYDEEERKARAALDRTLVSRGGILLPRWTMEVEHAFTYYNASADAISIDGFSILPVLVVGDIVSQRVQRDILLGTVTNRLGLPGDFQFEVRVPYGYELQRTVTADNQQTSTREIGIGDVELGLTKQVYRQKHSLPDLLVGARWKSTTGRDPFAIGRSLQPALGTGFQSIQGSLTAVKSSDPAVFFGGVSYTQNLSTDKGLAGLNPDHPDQITMGYIEPGGTIGFSVGSALALNPEASLNFALEERLTRTSFLNGQRIPGSFLNEGMLRIGTSYLYSPGRAIDVGLGIGVTRDAPDFQFSVAFPFRFSLRGLPQFLANGRSEKPKPQLARAAAQVAAP